MSAELRVFGEEVLWITAKYNELGSSGIYRRKMVTEQRLTKESGPTSQQELHVEQ